MENNERTVRVIIQSCNLDLWCTIQIISKASLKVEKPTVSCCSLNSLPLICLVQQEFSPFDVNSSRSFMFEAVVRLKCYIFWFSSFFQTFFTSQITLCCLFHNYYRGYVTCFGNKSADLIFLQVFANAIQQLQLVWNKICIIMYSSISISKKYSKKKTPVKFNEKSDHFAPLVF